MGYFMLYFEKAADRAAEFYRQALGAYKHIHEQTGTASALKNLFLSYKQMGDYFKAIGQEEEANEYYIKAKAVHEGKP
jgi:tetratricopeptide (TPR) repeat protein